MIKKAVHISGIKQMNTEHNKKNRKCYQNKGSKVQYMRTAVNTLFVSDSPGLLDFAIRIVIFVLNLPHGQVLFFGEIQITEGLQSILLIKKGFRAS